MSSRVPLHSISISISIGAARVNYHTYKSRANCFEINLLVFQISIYILFTDTSKAPRSGRHSVNKHTLLRCSLSIADYIIIQVILAFWLVLAFETSRGIRAIKKPRIRAGIQLYSPMCTHTAGREPVFSLGMNEPLYSWVTPTYLLPTKKWVKSSVLHFFLYALLNTRL